MNTDQNDISRGQRALWSFLLVTLVAPLMAAILAALYTPVAIWANIAPFAAGDHGTFDLANLPDAAGIMQLMAGAALRAFVWAPIAATVAAIIIVALLLLRGEVGWAFAGAAGVAGFFVGYVIAPFEADALLPLFALAAGLVTALLSIMLVRFGILPRATTA